MEVRIQELLGFFMDAYGPDKEATLNICFIVEPISNNPKPGDDIVELQWFSPDALPENIAFKNGEDMLHTWIDRLKN